MMHATKEKSQLVLCDLLQGNLLWAWRTGNKKFCKEVIIHRRVCMCVGVGRGERWRGVTMCKGPEAIAKKSCVTGEEE